MSTNDPNLIYIPYKDYINNSEEESFKILDELVLHNMGFGYTCFASSFAIFVSDIEISC